MSVHAAEKAKTESAVHDEKKERADKIDFKMVTFSLAGKEYGIDIMNVKEIAKAGRFTYVPNAAPFVRGVYNLRGDIISVIDLRTMFHLPAERKAEGALESLLILQVEEHVFGVIVDGIDKVVGVSRAGIQPPHPIFGDVNVKYILGIIESQGKLFIILNVEKLFAPKKAEAEKTTVEDLAPGRVRDLGLADRTMDNKADSAGDLTADFIKETLLAFRLFAVSSVNDAWFRKRYEEWRGMRQAMDLQLKEQGEAEQFLETFYSPCTGQLWSDEYAAAVGALMPDFKGKAINVWNPGCGKGHETFSLACLLKHKFPDARVKIWANDSDLLAISMAPNMVFMVENVPDLYVPYMVRGRNGWTFLPAIRDSIFFEFHDVLNANPIPPADVILCRDTVSFLPENDQKRLLADFGEKTKHGGLLILGTNERMPLEGWKAVKADGVSAYVKGA